MSDLTDISSLIFRRTVIRAGWDIRAALYEQCSSVSEPLSAPGRSWTSAQNGRVNLEEVAIDHCITRAATAPRSYERAKSA